MRSVSRDTFARQSIANIFARIGVSLFVEPSLPFFTDDKSCTVSEGFGSGAEHTLINE